MNYYYLTLMARKPRGSHRAYKEWVPSVKAIGTKYYNSYTWDQNGRATVNLKIYYVVMLIEVRLKKSENESEKQR